MNSFQGTDICCHTAYVVRCCVMNKTVSPIQCLMSLMFPHYTLTNAVEGGLRKKVFE
jgi:hypothetical protein